MEEFITTIIVLVIVLILFSNYKSSENLNEEKLDNYSEKLKDKYKILIDKIMKRSSYYKMKEIDSNNVKLQNIGIYFYLTQKNQKLHIKWHWDTFTGKSYDLDWDFNEFEDQNKMYEKLDKDIKTQNSIDSEITRKQTKDLAENKNIIKDFNLLFKQFSGISKHATVTEEKLNNLSHRIIIENFNVVLSKIMYEPDPKNEHEEGFCGDIIFFTYLKNTIKIEFTRLFICEPLGLENDFKFVLEIPSDLDQEEIFHIIMKAIWLKFFDTFNGLFDITTQNLTNTDKYVKNNYPIYNSDTIKKFFKEEFSIKAKYKYLISCFNDFDTNKLPEVLNDEPENYKIGWFNKTTIASITFFYKKDNFCVEYNVNFNFENLKRLGYDITNMPKINNKLQWSFDPDTDQALMLLRITDEINNNI